MNAEETLLLYLVRLNDYTWRGKLFGLLCKVFSCFSYSADNILSELICSNLPVC